MSGSGVRVRFAPSPTGYLHVGGARTTLFNWLFARHHGGTMILRIEDTDKNREVEGGLQAILDGIRWLGLDWDEGPEKGGDFGPYFQSQRQEIYDRHLEALRAKGHVYEEDNGAVRFRSPRNPVVVDDQICGRVEFQREEPDMTVRRPDGSYIFHFVNVIDDLEMRVSHVIRGEDHLSNTPKHIELFHALGATPPVYAHIPLILNSDGSKMSKRDQGASVGDYIERAYLPAAVANYLCLLGWSPKDDREKFSLAELVERFDLAHVNHANARFDFQKLLWLNGQYLMALSPDAFVEHCLPVLGKAGLPTDDRAKVERALGLVRTKVQVASDVADKIRFFFTEDCPSDPEAAAKLAKTPETPERLAKMAERLKDAEWTSAGIEAAILEAAKELGVGKGALMFPARVAASGQAGGPELVPMLELLGKDRVLARFAAAGGAPRKG